MNSSSEHADGSASATHCIFGGVDVGGTHIKLGIADDVGNVLGSDKIDTRNFAGPEPAMREVRVRFDRLLHEIGREWREVSALGLGTPGPMDISRGLILNPGNLPTWHGAPVRELLSKACESKPVAFTNDANAAAFCEYWVGAGRSAQSLVLLTLGTGVGGGIIVSGSCLEGYNSAAAEVGHICIDRRPSARLCPCGKRGHLEAYASATALIDRVREALDEGQGSSLSKAIDQGQWLSGSLIYQHAMAGDSLSLRFILETADYLAWAIADLAHVIDPEVFILGGAMNFGGLQSPIGRQFIERIEVGVRRSVFPVICEKFKIVYSLLGSNAGWVGAAGLARKAGLALSPE